MNNNIPSIRFDKFKSNWNIRQIGDLLVDVSRPIKMEEDQLYQLVTVKRRNAGIVSRGYFKGKDVLVKSQFIIKSGDYLISKRQIVHGANGIVPEYLSDSIVSNEYLVLHGTNELNIEYLSIVSKLPIMYKMFYLSSYGVDIEKLVFNVFDWKKRELIIPSIEEQNEITFFFNELDRLISLNQQELDVLKQTKQGFLQKMFPKNESTIPEVRFPLFSDKWISKKLKYVFKDFIVPMRDKPREFSGTIPWTRIEDIEGRYLNGSKSEQYVSEETVRSMNLKIIPKGSLIVSASATFGVVAIVNNNLTTNQTFIGLVPNENFDINFLYSFFQSFETRKKLKKESAGSTIFYISRKKFEEMTGYFPCKEEQVKIGEFFRQLDEVIELKEQELEALKQTKQGFLQKMFV